LRESGYFTVSISGSLLLGRNFEPFRQRWWPELSSSPDMSGHHAFRRDAHERAGNRTVLPEQDESYAGTSSATTVKTWEGLARLCAYLINQPAKLYALVEMSNHEIYQQIQRDMRNTIMLAVMIFVGCVVLAILLTWLVRNRNLEMQNMRRVVAQNKHLAAVGNLAGTIAHEVRNPLSSLRGLVQLIAKNLPEDSKEVEYAKVAVDEVQRLERVVSGLLNYTRPRTPRFVVLDFAETIRSVLQLVQDDNKAREVKLHLIMADTLPFIEADPDLLRQVLLNLIINALEAINGAGNIWISAEAADEGFVLIKIKDDGPGLPKKEDVFDPFFSTKAQGGGLGLAIAQQIVKSHQGCCLTARNSEDGGAIFELKLKAIHEQ
jgi:signal transduction histidine kinase